MRITRDETADLKHSLHRANNYDFLLSYLSRYSGVVLAILAAFLFRLVSFALDFLLIVSSIAQSTFVGRYQLQKLVRHT